jgi:SNF2 family DNA or RNA helicase
MKINVDLWEHQQQMVDYALNIFRNGFAEDVEFDHPDTLYAWWYAGCGVGKTLASLEVARVMGFKRILVLTKKAAITSAWLSDINTFTEGLDYITMSDNIETPDVVLRGGTSGNKAAVMKEHVKKATEPVVVVVNYETARLIVGYLNALKFDMVIADESHKLKAHNSKQSKALTRALIDVPYKIIMTGTGWSDRPTDVYGQVRFCDPVVKGRHISSSRLGNWGRFFDRYVEYYKQDNIPIPKYYKNLDELQEKLTPFTMHIDNEKVLGLPPAIHTERRLPMPIPMRTAYRELEEDMVTQIGDDLLMAQHRLTQSLRLHQLTGGFYPTEDGIVKNLLQWKDNPKIQAVIDIVEEIDGKPLVIFTRFKHDVALLRAALKAEGVEVKQLVGGTYEHDEWQAGEGQVLIANIQAGGTGVNLSRARYCIYYSVGHSRTDYEQSLARVRRAGSSKVRPVQYFHLMIENSVDVEIRRALEGKGKVSDYLLSGIVDKLVLDK